MPCFAAFGSKQGAVARIQAAPGDLLYHPRERQAFLARCRALPPLPSDPARLTVPLLRRLCQHDLDIPLGTAFRVGACHVDVPRNILVSHSERRFHACQKRKE
eukprot:13736466-Alexandrium_andersonii.AAC.1